MKDNLPSLQAMKTKRRKITFWKKWSISLFKLLKALKTKDTSLALYGPDACVFEGFFFLLELSYPDKKGKEVTYYLAKLTANFLDSVI